jgi:hypothetical protein
MSRSRHWAARAARSLAAHLDRLRETLTRLNGRLREAVAAAVGGGAAAAVEDAVRALLTGPAAPAMDSQSHRSPSHLWGGADYRDHPSWASHDGASYDLYDQDRRYDEPCRDEPVEPGGESASAPGSRAGRWGLALTAGLQAAAWWLHGRGGRIAALAALGVGAAAALAAYLAGPLLAAGASLAGSALTLAAVSDAARRAAALFRPGAG